MTTKDKLQNAKFADLSRRTVLRKLDEIGPMNLLEIGFSATPQLVRNMAARGLVRVEVTITARGKQFMEAATLKEMRRQVKAEKQKRGVA